MHKCDVIWQLGFEKGPERFFELFIIHLHVNIYMIVEIQIRTRTQGGIA